MFKPSKFCLTLLLILSSSSFAATKCFITTTDKATGEVKSKFMKVEYSMNMSSAGGMSLYEYKKPNRNESIRIQYGVMLADKTAKFVAAKFHKKVGTGTIYENNFCNINLTDGQGEENCSVDKLNVNFSCSQLDEGESHESLYALMEEVSKEKREFENLKRCAINLDIKYKKLSERRQAELSDDIITAIENRGGLFVDKKSVRAADTQIEVSKRLFNCTVKITMKSPSDENAIEVLKSRAFTCEKAIRKVMDKVKSCK